MKFIVALVIILLTLNTTGQNKLIIIKGQVKDASSGAPLIGVNISVQNTPFGTLTDGLGNYILNLKAGKYSITFSYVGYKTLVKNISIAGKETSFSLNISLESSVYVMNDVTVNANREPGNSNA